MLISQVLPNQNNSCACTCCSFSPSLFKLNTFHLKCIILLPMADSASVTWEQTQAYQVTGHDIVTAKLWKGKPCSWYVNVGITLAADQLDHVNGSWLLHTVAVGYGFPWETQDADLGFNVRVCLRLKSQCIWGSAHSSYKWMAQAKLQHVPTNELGMRVGVGRVGEGLGGGGSKTWLINICLTGVQKDVSVFFFSVLETSKAANSIWSSSGAAKSVHMKDTCDCCFSHNLCAPSFPLFTLI